MTWDTSRLREKHRQKALQALPPDFLPPGVIEVTETVIGPIKGTFGNPVRAMLPAFHGRTLYYARRASGARPSVWVKHGPITGTEPDVFWTADLGEIPIYRDVIACAFID